LIVAGSTGFVGTEVIRQAIHHPSITSVVGLARRATPPPEAGSPKASKFKSVVCEDFSNYSDSVKEELRGADACIWLLAVTPSSIKTLTLDEIRKICQDYTVTGLEALTALSKDANKSLRFVYASGSNAQRDQTKKPWVLGDYSLLRGECENRVLDAAKQSNGVLESYILKPGLLSGPGRDGIKMQVTQFLMSSMIGLPHARVQDVSAAALHIAVHGFENDTISNEDLTRIGQKALGEQ
ncbi:hypothetical protein QQS21_012352, partial [Conoideocrella luteorostrata]